MTADLHAIFERIPLLSQYRLEDFKIEQLKGLTNHSYRLRNQQQDWILRVPGSSTQYVMRRDFEAFNSRLIAPLQLTPTTLWRDASGLSLSLSCIQARPLDRRDMSNQTWLETVVDRLCTLHNSGLGFAGIADLPSLLSDYYHRLNNPRTFKVYFEKIQQRLTTLHHKQPAWVPSHNDLVLENLLVDREQRLWMIDWEYSAMASPYWDLGTLCNSARFDATQSKRLLNQYRLQSTDLDFNQLRYFQQGLQLLSIFWLKLFSTIDCQAEIDWLQQIDA